MKPRAFQYESVTTLDEAYALLAKHGDSAKVLAGGQSLVPMMNFRVSSPAVLIDINRIDALRLISEDNGELRIGALTRHHQMQTSLLVARHAPLLRLAVEHVAHLAIRNRGTFGGSLCQADPAAEFPSCAVLLDATMEIGSARGTRLVKAREFFHGPFTTAVEADEILLAVRIPKALPGARFAIDEISRRHGDFAIAGLAVSVCPRAGEDVFEWVAFGIADRPLLLSALPALWASRRGTPDRRALAQAIATDFAPHVDDGEEGQFKQRLAAELVSRCLQSLSQPIPHGAP
ncbi:FAD binding domain-containing protein [Variovorax sp. LjRoot130]|uniref:FAD binding domain-containing protein n=1 Tax=unclassified Variovorax TaxID=663243 RepID=UPI003ECF66AC